MPLRLLRGEIAMNAKILLRARSTWMFGGLALAATLAVGACGDDIPSDQTSSTGSDTSSSAQTSSGTTGSGSSSSSGGGGGGGGPDCFMNPMTHIEIINA